MARITGLVCKELEASLRTQASVLAGSKRAREHQVLRRLLPVSAEPDFRDPSGTIRLDQVPVPAAWIGQRTIHLQEQTQSRIAWIDRLGEGMLPNRDSVLQEGDLLHLVMREENASYAYTILARGPEEH